MRACADRRIMLIREMTTGDTREARDRLNAAASVLAMMADALDNPRPDDRVEWVLTNINSNQGANVEPAVKILKDACG
jgi:hypothetical protein